MVFRLSGALNDLAMPLALQENLSHKIHYMVYRKYPIRGIEILYLGDALRPSGEASYYHSAIRGSPSPPERGRKVANRTRVEMHHVKGVIVEMERFEVA